MPAVIAKSCNKILIGKNILEKCCSTFHYAWYRNCLFHKKKDLRLTNRRNKAFRCTVNARKCTAISALRGEMGASLQKTRHEN